MPKAIIADAFDPQAIRQAARVIREGGLVAFPTETVYGLGADAENPLAVARIFEVKARPRIDPVIVHVDGPAAAARYGLMPDSAHRLMERFWPGALTLVIRKTEEVPPIVTAGLDTVGVRNPSHPAALELIHACGRGIAAPSANMFGYVSPTSAEHVADQMGDSIDMILDGGSCPVGVESTILSLTGAVPRLLRAGGVPLEELEASIGHVQISTGVEEQPAAPGQLKRHYATRTPLDILAHSEDNLRPDERVGLLTLTAPDNLLDYAAVEVLSGSGNLTEAAAGFFAALRRLDALGLDRIIARPMPERGLGRALMDRLRRCSARE